MKKFIDINNLRILWEEINKRFVRTGDFIAGLKSLDSLTFTSTLDIQLRPNSSWEVNEDFYNEFIDFVNADNMKLYILDADEMLWEVIGKSFYKTSYKKFSGVILSANSNISGTCFWYIKVFEEGGKYYLEWNEWFGDIDTSVFVPNSSFVNKMEVLDKEITDIKAQIKKIQEVLDIKIEEEQKPEEKIWWNKKVKLYNEDNELLGSTSISNIKLLNAPVPLNIKDYVDYKYDAAKKLYEIKIVDGSSAAITFKKAGYKNTTLELSFDSVGDENGIHKVIMEDVDVVTTSTTIGVLPPSDDETTPPPPLY